MAEKIDVDLDFGFDDMEDDGMEQEDNVGKQDNAQPPSTANPDLKTKRNDGHTTDAGK